MAEHPYRDAAEPDTTDNIVLVGFGKLRLRVVSSVPTEYRGYCDTCRYLVGYVSWWCDNDDALAQRSTAVPGAGSCEFWGEPALYEPFYKRAWRGLIRLLTSVLPTW